MIRPVLRAGKEEVTQVNDVSRLGEEPILFPNPGGLECHFSVATETSVRVMDMAGRVVLAHSVNAEGANACQLNIARCNAGMYILVVNKHDQRWTQPLLIE